MKTVNQEPTMEQTTRYGIATTVDMPYAHALPPTNRFV
jgi:hypothetical protein